MMSDTCTQVSVVIINKGDPGVEATLSLLSPQCALVGAELLVVDASDGRLDGIRSKFPSVKWVAYGGAAGRSITIADQRNIGVEEARGSVIAFTDASCLPVAGWLEVLTEPIRRGDERVTAGMTLPLVGKELVYRPISDHNVYVHEAPTINLAFLKSDFYDVGGFDDRFAYGSDIDFTWRLRQAGLKIRVVPEAVVRHDWGGGWAQARRSYRYGVGRARLYRKHPVELRFGLRRDPVAFAYPAFLLLLPFSLHKRFRAFPATLLIPLWRARKHRPLPSVGNNIVFGAGALREFLRGWPL